ncbi:MAG: penicillin-insensitive murein DD-endopeptidase [Solirubrobacteraceae bacterium]
MRRAVLALLVGAALCAPPAVAQVPPPDPAAPAHSVAVGKPWDGRLEHGAQLPAEGPDFVTWDQVLRQSPNRGGRRWGTEELLAVLETVTREFRAAHPGVPRVLISDLSRPHGGPFGREYGGLGHASHQNGLDADVMYPRRDGLLRAALRPAQVDRALAQDLVDRFLRAGAVKLFVGPHLHLGGPRDVVVALAHHDDHVHVRIPTPPGE